MPHVAELESLGLYLHIPFCAQICPYCPYNKELFHADVAAQYVTALKREVDRHAVIVGDRPITSFYIGGGTPTSMLHAGLGPILEHIYRSFKMECPIHLESHPNDLSAENLRAIRASASSTSASASRPCRMSTCGSQSPCRSTSAWAPAAAPACPTSST